jgi:hypothetical protein
MDSKLSETGFDKCTIGSSLFVNNDLSKAKGLEAIRHCSPSSIGIDTLYKSHGLIPDQFLRDAGVPEEANELARSIRRGPPIQWDPYFISYSSQDEDFARRLHARMREAQLRVWFAPEDDAGGKRLPEHLFEALRIHGKLLLVLSDASIQSKWVTTVIRSAREIERKERLQSIIKSGECERTEFQKLKQVEKTDRTEWLRVMAAIQKAREQTREIEKQRNWRKLFPIRLVDPDAIRDWTCFDSSGKDLAVEVRESSMPDFSNWKDHDAFESAFKRLLGGPEDRWR